MAQISISSRPQSDSNIFDSFNFINLSDINQAPETDLVDLTSLICVEDRDQLGSIPNLWSDSDNDLHIITPSEYCTNPKEGVSLAAIAKNHFLSNDIKNESDNIDLNSNSIESLASLLEAVCPKEDETDSGKSSNEHEKNHFLLNYINNGSDNIDLNSNSIESLASLLEAVCPKGEDETDSGKNSNEHDIIQSVSYVSSEIECETNDFEVNLDICLKGNTHSLNTNDSFTASQKNDDAFNENLNDLTSDETILDEPQLLTSGSNSHLKTNPKLLYNCNSHTKGKPSLFAKALSCKSKSDQALQEKVLSIEKEMSNKYFQMTQIFSKHWKTEKSKANLTHFDESILKDIVGRYNYGKK